MRETAVQILSALSNFGIDVQDPDNWEVMVGKVVDILEGQDYLKHFLIEEIDLVMTQEEYQTELTLEEKETIANTLIDADWSFFNDWVNEEIVGFAEEHGIELDTERFPDQSPVDEIHIVYWVVRKPEFITYEFCINDAVYVEEADDEFNLFRLFLNMDGSAEIKTANEFDFETAYDVTHLFDLKAIKQICLASEVGDITKDYDEHYLEKATRGIMIEEEA